jgi:hypothetical protein
MTPTESPEKPDVAWSPWGGAILVFLFALNCYRAAKQPFTQDESLYFQFYIDGPLSRVFVPS